MNEIDLTDGHGKHRAEDVLPAGYTPSHQTQLEYIAQGLGEIRAGAATIDSPIAEMIGAEASQLQRIVRAIASGALVVALALVAAVAAPSAPAQAATVAATASTPAIEGPEPDPSPAKHATRFGKGTWLDACNGDLLVAAPLAELFPGVGWQASPDLPVQVQEFSVKRGRWVIRKVMLTNARGVAVSVVHIGGGIKTVRVVATETPWTLRATGTTRKVNVTTEPCDIV